jgi:hypothetical protein
MGTPITRWKLGGHMLKKLNEENLEEPSTDQRRILVHAELVNSDPDGVWVEFHLGICGRLMKDAEDLPVKIHMDEMDFQSLAEIPGFSFSFGSSGGRGIC